MKNTFGNYQRTRSISANNFIEAYAACSGNTQRPYNSKVEPAFTF